MKPRTRRVAQERRSRPGGAETVAPPEGFPPWEHGSLTFEGEIERLGAISANMATAPRWTRFVARGVALMILGPIAVFIGIYLVGLFAH